MSLQIDKILNQSGDPELAHRQWDSFQQLIPKDFLKKKGASDFLRLFGNCHPFLHWLQHDETLTEQIITSPYLLKPKTPQILRREWNPKNPTLEQMKRQLRRFRHAEMLRLIIRELAGIAAYPEIGRELAALADVCLQAAMDFCQAPPEFTVIGLGKHGGEDLNFSSDIDVLFLYSADANLPDPHSTRHEYADQLFKRVSGLIHEKTEDGFVFRVDTNLRPEGKKGVLTNSLDALESYYETWGSTWERCALLKARCVAGDQSVGREFLQRTTPFVYRKSLDTQSLSDIKSMKQKIDAEQGKAMRRTFNVKLGHGGIREVEFFVSVFQLIYGGKIAALRQHNTLEALHQLVQSKLLPKVVAEGLEGAYIFLRRIENRLQILDDQQTHHLPEKSEELKQLARRMGFSETEPFLDELKQRSEVVHQHFEQLAL